MTDFICSKFVTFIFHFEKKMFEMYFFIFFISQ